MLISSLEWFVTKWKKAQNLPDVEDEQSIEENFKAIRSKLSVGNYTILAAWGDSIELHTYLVDCIKKIADIAAEYNCEWK